MLGMSTILRGNLMGEIKKLIFDQVTVRKIVKVIATVCHVLMLLTGSESTADSAGGACSVPPDSLAGF